MAFLFDVGAARANKSATIVWGAAFAAAAILVLVPQFLKIFLVGNCCADDSYFSMIARTLIETGQYGLPTSSTDVSVFDPAIGSGPALVLPGAAMMLAFGPQRWVPGLSTVLTFALQYVVFLSILRSMFSLRAALAYGSVGLVVAFVATTYQDYFSQFLGEGPMTGYLLIGCATLALLPATKWRVTLAGLSFGLALLVKDIAIFCVAGACLAWLVTAIADRRPFLRDAIILASAIALPYLAFEIVKIAVLGLGGYLEHLASYFAVVRAYNHLPAEERFGAFFDLMARLYQLTPEAVGLLLASLATLVIRRRLDQAARLGIVMLGAMAVELAYMAFVSRMTPRYAFSGVMMLCFIIPLPLLFLRDAAKPVFAAIVAVLFCTPAALAKSYAWQTRLVDGSYIVEQARIAKILDEHPDLPLFGQSWHSLFDNVYLLPAGRAWVATNDEKVVPDLRAIVVFNGFVGRKYLFYKDVVSICRRIAPRLEIYEVYLCGDKPTATGPAPSASSST